MLVAEDDPDDVFLLQRALAKSRLPINAHYLPDGNLVLDYLHGVGPFQDRQAYPFPRILMLDIKMPGMGGFEILHDVRSDPNLKRVVAVMFTNSPVVRDIDRAYDLGANAYVVKPGDPADLVTFLRRIYDFWFLTNKSSPGLHAS